MDETQNNGMREHHKIRWIIIFVACLIILVAIVMTMRREEEIELPVDTTPQVISEEDLVRAMTAKPSTLSNSQIQSVLEASSAGASGMTAAQKQDLIDAMSSQ